MTSPDEPASIPERYPCVSRQVEAMTRSRSNTTYVIDSPCTEQGTHCIVEVDDENGVPTGFLWCPEHGNVVGVRF